MKDGEDMSKEGGQVVKEGGSGRPCVQEMATWASKEGHEVQSDGTSGRQRGEVKRRQGEET